MPGPEETLLSLGPRRRSYYLRADDLSDWRGGQVDADDGWMEACVYPAPLYPIMRVLRGFSETRLLPRVWNVEQSFSHWYDGTNIWNGGHCAIVCRVKVAEGGRAGRKGPSGWLEHRASRGEEV